MGAGPSTHEQHARAARSVILEWLRWLGVAIAPAMLARQEGPEYWTLGDKRQPWTSQAPLPEKFTSDLRAAELDPLKLDVLIDLVHFSDGVEPLCKSL